MKVKITTNKSDAIFLLPAVGITINYKAFTIHMAMWNYVLNIEVEH